MDHRLMSYLYYFNVEQDYYECHEYCEHYWFDIGRPKILKGLIQSAVCLYHLKNGNVRGSWQMWQRAKEYLRTESPVYQGMDIARLMTDIDDVFQRVPNQWRSKRVTQAQIKELKLPTVKFHFVDEEIGKRLSTWVPVPLEAPN